MEDNRLYHLHSNYNLLRQKLCQMVANYAEDDVSAGAGQSGIAGYNPHMQEIRALLIDLDSIHADTYGDQKSNAYNTHYNTVGFHPIVAFDEQQVIFSQQ